MGTDRATNAPAALPNVEMEFISAFIVVKFNKLRCAFYNMHTRNCARQSSHYNSCYGLIIGPINNFNLLKVPLRFYGAVENDAKA